MSSVFRGKLLAAMHQAYKEGKLNLSDQLRGDYKYIKNKMYKTPWVVYAKQAFGGPDQVLEYLGRYTHKICISNHRILKVTDTHVTFRYLDRKKKRSRTKTIPGVEFLALFAEHILPKRFVKIRHFGFLSSRSKKTDLQAARASLGCAPPARLCEMTTRELIIHNTGQDPYLCPKCGQGEMVIITVIHPIRGSPSKTRFRGIPKDRKVDLG